MLWFRKIVIQKWLIFHLKFTIIITGVTQNNDSKMKGNLQSSRKINIKSSRYFKSPSGFSILIHRLLTYKFFLWYDTLKVNLWCCFECFPTEAAIRLIYGFILILPCYKKIKNFQEGHSSYTSVVISSSWYYFNNKHLN